MEESPLDVNKAYAFVLCEGVEVVCTSTEIIYDKGVNRSVNATSTKA
jgi:hypothetical protein